MMTEMYDVIIVGAGPAGGSAAYFLGQAGKRMLVLEKEALPRYKTCGGGISVKFLQKLFPFSFDPVLETNINQMTYDFKGVTISVPVQPGVIGMVMRDKFDAYLLSQANVEVRQGRQVRTVREFEDRVEVETREGDQFACKYLIGADGANSVIAREAGLRKKKRLAAAIEVEVPATPEQVKQFQDRPVFIFGEVRLGYMWIFPKSDHLSVGIAALHPRRGMLQKRLEKVMQRYGIHMNGGDYHGHPIPLYQRREPIATQRILLAGDAAGLVDPLSGEGIRYAIKSGQLAAESILNGDVQQYPRLVRKHIGLNHSLALYVSLFFYNLQPLCLLFGAPNPFTTQAIADLLSDQAGTWQVMGRALITLPLFWGTEVVAGVAELFGKREQGEKIRTSVYGLKV